jgi:hypothetical protein
MGESFKLHSQALVGYEDAIASGSGASTPTMSSQGVELDMDSGFWSEPLHHRPASRHVPGDGWHARKGS